MKRRTPEQQAAHTARAREWRAQRRAQGLCVQCNDVVHRAGYCEPHYLRHRARMNETERRRRVRKLFENRPLPP